MRIAEIYLNIFAIPVLFCLPEVICSTESLKRKNRSWTEVMGTVIFSVSGTFLQRSAGMLENKRLQLSLVSELHSVLLMFM